MDQNFKNWRLRSELFLVLMTVVWGGTFIFIKLSLDTIPPNLFLAIRFGIALLFSLLLWGSSLREVKLHGLFIGMTVGVVMFLGYYFQTTGLETVSATQSGFITGTHVIITPIIESIWMRRLPPVRVLISVAVVFSGILLISFDSLEIDASIWMSVLSLDFWKDIGFQMPEGNILTLLGALSFSMYIVLIDRASRKWKETSLLIGQLTTAFLLASILALMNGNFDLGSFRPNRQALFGIFYTGIIATILPVLIQTRYQKAVSPTRAGIIFSLEPVFASIFAFLVVGELLGKVGFIGCGFVFLGILLSILGKKK